MLAWGLIHLPAARLTVAPFAEIRDGFPCIRRSTTTGYSRATAKRRALPPGLGSADLYVNTIVGLPRHLPNARVGLKLYNLASITPPATSSVTSRGPTSEQPTTHSSRLHDGARAAMGTIARPLVSTIYRMTPACHRHAAGARAVSRRDRWLCRETCREAGRIRVPPGDGARGEHRRQADAREACRVESTAIPRRVRQRRRRPARRQQGSAPAPGRPRLRVAAFSSPDAFGNVVAQSDRSPNYAAARGAFSSIVVQAKRALALPDRTPLVVAGLSRGANVVIASAGDPTLKTGIGAAAIALTREFDDLTIPDNARQLPNVKMDDKGRLQTYPAIERLGSIPLAIIQSTNDSYVPSGRVAPPARARHADSPPV